MDTIALQAAFILGVTSFVAKFIHDPDERDTFLPMVACVLGMVSGAYLFGWTLDNVIIGAITGGTVTGLYSVATGDGRKKVTVVETSTTDTVPAVSTTKVSTGTEGGAQ